MGSDVVSISQLALPSMSSPGRTSLTAPPPQPRLRWLQPRGGRWTEGPVCLPWSPLPTTGKTRGRCG